jgi:phosphoribosyl 1,2-cyclic phosphodiesterase
MKKEILILHFSNQKNDPELPHSFSLRVKKENGVLSIDGKKIKGDLNWDM